MFTCCCAVQDSASQEIVVKTDRKTGFGVSVGLDAIKAASIVEPLAPLAHEALVQTQHPAAKVKESDKDADLEDGVQRDVTASTCTSAAVDDDMPEADVCDAPLLSCAPQQRDLSSYGPADYGRFKYCGLRPEPLAEIEPPLYSLVEPDFVAPVLEPEVARKVDELAKRLGDIKAAGHRTDRTTLWRFLVDRGWDVEDAEAHFRAAIEFRKAHDVDRALTTWDLDLYEKHLMPWWPCGGALGHGLQGEPIIMEHTGAIDVQMITELPFDALQKLDIVHCLRTLGGLEEDALHRKVPYQQAIVLLNMEGFGWQHCNLQAVKIISKLFQTRSFLLAGIVKKILMVNAPWMVVRAWSMFKNLLLSGSVQELVEIVDKKNTPDLLRCYVDDSVLPKFFGGSRTIGDDADCRLLISPGGRPPAERVQQFIHRLN
eukprot:TRINITY_DN44010_c0_g1_i1.p1 TRINITY_DN44010_c0_g1~~TRINITY_DN44010_c0_g1_i1.p1  ORF type:complete len:429 (-),score=65.28 TRINITY_DN44010_c0_g1_i1:215-1501(-)